MTKRETTWYALLAGALLAWTIVGRSYVTGILVGIMIGISLSFNGEE